jgi:hypothetical protein
MLNVTQIHPQDRWARGLVLTLLALAVLAPFVVLAQVAGVDPDNLGALATMVLDAIRGGDKQLAVLAVLVLAVSLVRRLAGKIPKVQAFLASDPGGVLLTIATVVPLALLTADLAGQPLTWRLAWASVTGAVGGFVLLRKLVRPLLGYVPKVGPFLQAAIDLVTGSPKTA